MKKKKNKNKALKKATSSRLNKKKIRQQVLDVFSTSPEKLLNYKQVSSKLGIKDTHNRQVVIQLLLEMTAKGDLKEVERGRYKLDRVTSLITGRVDMTQSGSAYVITDDVEEDVYIPPKFVHKALHGDTVKVFLLAKRRRKGPEGQIIEIAERAKETFVGTIEISPNFAFLVPDSRKMHVDLYIPLNKLNGAKDGQKAIARLTDWPEEASSPFGEITEVLGDPGNNDVEINSILADFGFPVKFPSHVEDEASKIPLEIDEAEIAKRKDYREVTTFTIDPHDAKDFDDAISYKKLENGNIEVGVHIADVTHYVREGGIIDKEAVSRATSVYLVDRVIPMLPEVLSNKVCSLRPNEEKLTFAALFEMNDKAEVVNQWVGRTVINSNRRFTYEEAQEIIEGKPGDFAEELKQLNELAKTLRGKRLDSGAIAFEKVEVRFKVDEDKNPSEVFFKIQKDAHKLIEEFMLLANRTVATMIAVPPKGEQKKTFVYRIHDQPDPEKIADFVGFIKKFGYRFKAAKGGDISHSMNALLRELEGSREKNMIETLAIRTMAKAIYSTANIGHYGLAFPNYTHFTSPIRRYPDVMVHRLLESYLSGGNSANEEKYEQLCKHSSQMERQAAEAERESIKFFQVLFMKDSVGHEFEGVISGVTEWGIYVEIIENKCEGMIRLREISGDYYVFDEKNYRIIGHNEGKIFQLGDQVRIRIKHADLHNKRLDFELAEASAGADDFE